MKALLTIQTKAKGRERQRLALSYSVLKTVASAKLYEPALKNYLFSQLKSPFNYIEPEEYRIALTVPVQKWRRGRPY